MKGRVRLRVKVGVRVSWLGVGVGIGVRVGVPSPQQVWPHGSILTSAFSSRQTGHSSRPVLSMAAFQPFFWLVPSIAAAHGAGFSSSAACARAAAAAARAAT